MGCIKKRGLAMHKSQSLCGGTDFLNKVLNQMFKSIEAPIENLIKLIEKFK